MRRFLYDLVAIPIAFILTLIIGGFLNSSSLLVPIIIAGIIVYIPLIIYWIYKDKKKQKN